MPLKDIHVHPWSNVFTSILELNEVRAADVTRLQRELKESDAASLETILMQYSEEVVNAAFERALRSALIHEERYRRTSELLFTTESMLFRVASRVNATFLVSPVIILLFKPSIRLHVAWARQRALQPQLATIWKDWSFTLENS